MRDCEIRSRDDASGLPAKELGNEETGRRLGISGETVRTHIHKAGERRGMLR
jgi:DNA-binding CsgD family transcriptional regulator